MGNTDYLVELYGVRRFLTDLDRDRQFWRDGGDSIVAAHLDWCCNEGFGYQAEKHDLGPYASAHEYRQRFLLHAIKELRRG